MDRRGFIKSISKYTIGAASISAVTATVAKSKNVAEQSINGLADQFNFMKNKVNKMERTQKRMFKALIVITAVSTGMDLSLML